MKAQEKLALYTGAVVITLLMAGGIIAGLYWLTGAAGPNGARWWAVIATLVVPAAVIVTYRLATHAAREHLSGLDRGIDHAEKTITSLSRGLSASASLARSVRSVRPANDDLLPKVGTMRLIDSPEGEDLIDL